MRQILFFLLLLAACAAGEPPALTHEQAQVLMATVTEITPGILERTPEGVTRRRIKRELKALTRTLERGTTAQVNEAVRAVRKAAGDPLDDELAYVLQQAETAANHQRRPTP